MLHLEDSSTLASGIFTADLYKPMRIWVYPARLEKQSVCTNYKYWAKRTGKPVEMVRNEWMLYGPCNIIHAFPNRLHFLYLG